MLLLHLAPPEYELKLFSIDKYQKEAYQNNEGNLYILVRDYMIFIRDVGRADSILLLISKTLFICFV